MGGRVEILLLNVMRNWPCRKVGVPTGVGVVFAAMVRTLLVWMLSKRTDALMWVVPVTAL
jgi:hypothetical protein